MGNNFKILGVIVLVTVLGAAGWLFVTKQSQNGADLTQKGVEVKNNNRQEEKQVVKEDGQKQGEEKVEELKTTDIDTSNWKTYRNEEFGFEVKYPEGWEITPRSEHEDAMVWSIGLREKNKYYSYEGSLEDIAVHIIVQRGDETYLNNSRQHTLNVLRDRGATIKMINIEDSKGYYFSGFGEGYEIYRQIYTISISSSILEDVKKELAGMFGTLKFTK
jgi:hypothetical protein